MVAKDDAMANHKPSSWLAKTEDGSNRLSRWVWVVGIILLLVSSEHPHINHNASILIRLVSQCIGGGAGLGWYLTHNQPSNQQPKAFGGSANEQPSATISSSSAAPALSSSPHVYPTNTVARREALPEPSGAAIYMAPQQRSTFDNTVFPPKRHNRRVHQH